MYIMYDVTLKMSINSLLGGDGIKILRVEGLKDNLEII